MNTIRKKPKRKIGWREIVDLPELGLFNLESKVDTGAGTAVLHCSKIELIKKYRRNYVKFIPLDKNYTSFVDQEIVLPYHKERKIKSSFGQEEQRIVISTIIKMFNREFEIELSLRDRSNMEFPFLLGRRTIRGRFIVDVSRSNLSHKHFLKKKSNN